MNSELALTTIASSAANIATAVAAAVVASGGGSSNFARLAVKTSNSAAELACTVAVNAPTSQYAAKVARAASIAAKTAAEFVEQQKTTKEVRLIAAELARATTASEQEDVVVVENNVVANIEEERVVLNETQPADANSRANSKFEQIDENDLFRLEIVDPSKVILDTDVSNNEEIATRENEPTQEDLNIYFTFLDKMRNQREKFKPYTLWSLKEKVWFVILGKLFKNETCVDCGGENETCVDWERGLEKIPLDNLRDFNAITAKWNVYLRDKRLKLWKSADNIATKLLAQHEEYFNNLKNIY